MDMNEDKEKKGSKGSTSRKIKALQKQYNNILVSLFDQYACESIEEALESVDGSFGENIGSIVQNALDILQQKVLNELGVKSGATNGGGVAIEILGGEGEESDFVGEPGAEFGEISAESEDEDEEDPAHEAEETEEEEKEERESGEEDEDEESEDKDE